MKIYRAINEFFKTEAAITVDGESLQINWTNPRGSTPDGESVTLDFAQLKTQSTFADHTLWALSSSTKTWLPVYAETIVTKQSVSDYAHTVQSNFIALLYVRLASDNLADCVLKLNLSEDSTLETGGLPVDTSVCDPKFPSIALGSPSVAGGVITFPVNLLDSSGNPLSANATVYAESTVGALLTTRVSLNGGVGAIKLLATGIEGQSGKVKAGFKFYSGVAEQSFTA